MGRTLLAVALAGCGADGGTSAEERTGPLAEFFGSDGGSGDFLDDQRRMEELIAACMAEQGFDYEPVSYDELARDPAFVAEQELSPEEYARQYGYGLTTSELNVQIGGAVRDPNLEAVAAMGQAEQEAYNRALHGDLHPLEWEGLGEGCRGEAAQQVHGYGPSDGELQPRYEELNERIDADARMVAATRAWSRCMAEAGYDFSEPDDPRSSIARKHSELFEEAGGPAVTENPAFAELREEEIAIAVTDQACQAEHLPPSLREEVGAAYEQEFLEANRALLERVRDGARSGG